MKTDVLVAGSANTSTLLGRTGRFRALNRLARIGAMAAVTLVGSVGVLSTFVPRAGAQESSPAVKPVVPLAADALYAGWRASRIVSRDVRSKDGRKLGTLRNILMDPTGKITALVVETAGTNEHKEFMFRVPWADVNHAALPNSITTDLTSADRPELRIFSTESGASANSNPFALSQVVGEYARLQAGQGFGYVTDVVFAHDGSMVAVLVTRELGKEGGGTYAFGFPGTVGHWRPEMSYYGLPYVTSDQALAAALPVDLARFRGRAG